MPTTKDGYIASQKGKFHIIICCGNLIEYSRTHYKETVLYKQYRKYTILAVFRFLANANTITMMALITSKDNSTTMLGMSFDTSAKEFIEYVTGFGNTCLLI